MLFFAILPELYLPNPLSKLEEIFQKPENQFPSNT